MISILLRGPLVVIVIIQRYHHEAIMEMKLVMYSSSATVLSESSGLPVGLAAIIKTCQNNNNKNNVTGALYFGHGYYLQVIEGECETIDRLMVKILKDPRHENCLIQLDVKIRQRMFPRWQCQLALMPARDPFLRKLLSKYSQQLKSMSDTSKAALMHIFQKATSRQKTKLATLNTHCSLDVFGSEIISLTNLPDQEEISLTPLMMNLCRLLMRQPHSVEQLVIEYGVGKRDEILTLLRDLNHQGLLEFIDDESVNEDYSFNGVSRIRGRGLL